MIEVPLYLLAGWCRDSSADNVADEVKGIRCHESTGILIDFARHKNGLFRHKNRLSRHKIDFERCWFT